MALQRQNPLPVGRYWVDVTEKDFSKFEEWLKTNTASLQVITTEEKERRPVTPGETGPIGYSQYWPATRWYLFDVKAPVNWEGPGFPTIAGEGVTSSEDTVDRPPPMTPGDVLEEVLPKGINLGPIVLVAGLFGLAYLIKQVKS